MRDRYTTLEGKNEMPGIRRFTGKTKKAWEQAGEYKMKITLSQSEVVDAIIDHINKKHSPWMQMNADVLLGKTANEMDMPEALEEGFNPIKINLGKDSIDFASNAVFEIDIHEHFFFLVKEENGRKRKKEEG
jgi:hypothetical protein